MVSQWALINAEMDNNMTGYKRVAWPPVSEERTVRQFTPQPAATSVIPSGTVKSEQYRASSYDNHYQRPLPQQQQSATVYQQQSNWAQQQQQQQPNWAQKQQYQPPIAPQSQQHNYYAQHQQQQQQQPPPQYQSHPYDIQQNFANQSKNDSYSQLLKQKFEPPRAQTVSQDQVDQIPINQGQTPPQEISVGSPGIIQLRAEAPVNQEPSPVHASQPATVSLNGGSKMRGDLKWPPPEYKVAAAQANEERRQLALGPANRPRRVARDYTSFFAQNAINSYYPSYKVPPGTQHM